MKFCLWPGCTKRTRGAYCDDHSRSYERTQRGSAQERGYDARWTIAARAFLREFPLCGMRPSGRPPVMSRCHDQHRVTPATLVDHVDPHRGDQAKFWDRAGNWQALCRDCHDAKTRAGL